MVTSSGTFKSGKEINPHIPQYMSSVPWYLNAERPSLKHQRKWNSDPKDWYARGAKIFQADKSRKEACKNGRWSFLFILGNMKQPPCYHWGKAVYNPSPHFPTCPA